MNKERMERLAEVLRGVIAERKAFNMLLWAGAAGNAARHYMVGDAEESCGTACCAFGHAALDPALRAQGLGLRVETHEGEFIEVSTPDRLAAAMRQADVRYAEPHFEGREGTNAAEAFFGLGYDAVRHLFYPETYEGYMDRDEPVPPQEVLARVLEMIASGGEVPHRPDVGED